MPAPSLTLDPTPVAFAGILARLPAAERARLAWFPNELRLKFVDPLTHVDDPDDLRANLDQHLRRCVPVIAKLMGVLREIVRDAGLRSLISWLDDDKIAQTHELIERRLAPHDAFAADALREAYAWFVELLPIVFQSAEARLSDEDLQRWAGLTDEQLAAEMPADLDRGGRSFFQLECLVLAATDVLSREDLELPPLLGEWCVLAMDAAHATVDELRRLGVPLGLPRIPGFTHKQWRERWADRVLEGMDDEELALFEGSLERRRSSRSR